MSFKKAIKTRLTKSFGEKIKGEALKSLITTLGENPNKLLKTNLENEYTKRAYGRVSYIPVIGGTEVDLYVFRTDYKDSKKGFSVFPALDIFIEGPVTVLDDKNVQDYLTHLQGRIDD